MNIQIEVISSEKASAWDEYVCHHPRGTLYHLSGWQEVIQKAYGHRPYYLMAVTRSSSGENYSKNSEGAIIGVLPMIHMRHFLFGNRLVSIPFFDMGGIIAENEETEKALLTEAERIGKYLGAECLELRNHQPLGVIENDDRRHQFKNNRSHKVRMVFKLPERSEILINSFKSKLRSQIRSSMKVGLRREIGGLELLGDFYEVFALNMRDLGSPVHSRKIIQKTMEKFKEKSRIVIIFKENRPAACSLVIGFKDILANPWASALRQYSGLSPNMLLYWTMLEYACAQGYRFFDFGRSTPGGGTYHFKEQWGAAPQPLNWEYILLNGKPMDADQSEKSKLDRAIEFWKKLPVPVTRVLGPMIRKHISL